MKRRTAHLEWEQLTDVVSRPDRRLRVIAAATYEDLKLVEFVWGNGDRSAVGFDYFEPCGDRSAPDYAKPYVDDWGLTIGFGKDYEVSSMTLYKCTRKIMRHRWFYEA